MSQRLKPLVSYCAVLALVLASLAEAADPSLVVWWRLDEGAGTVATDSSGNGNDGTFVNGPEWTAGILGGALHFRGDTDQDSVVYTLPEDAVWQAGTVAIWAKPDSLGQDNWSSVFTNYTPNTAGIQFDVDGGDPGNYRINPGGVFFGPATLEWTHLALAWEGDSGTLYYNGEATQTATLSDSQRTFNEFAIGINRNHTNWMASTLDDFRVYDRALAAEEIQKAMQGEQGTSSSPTPPNEAVDVPRDTILA